MPARPSDKYIPLYFVAFFLVIFAVNGVFVYYATQTHSGVVTENAYEKGRAYNETIALSDKQQNLGIESEINVIDDEIIFSFDQQADVTAHIIRPTQDGHDYKLKLDKDNGNYKNKANFPMKGQWEIRIVAKWDDGQYQQSKRIVVQ